MARPVSLTPPAYRLHKPTGQAVVTLNGQDYYLGVYKSPESRAEYDRLIAEWLAHGRRLPERRTDDQGLTVGELIGYYWRHAERYYVKDGEPTGEQANVRQALRWLDRLYGHTQAAAFGPLALKAVRGRMVESGQARTYVNSNILRIKSAFRWATENELLPSSVYHALQAVAGLRRGRDGVRETEPVRPVPDLLVDAIQGHVSPQVWSMVMLQRLTGMRPGEVVRMRGCDLDTTGELWQYRPARHKTEHHGKCRIIDLGPRAQAVLKPFLKSDLQDYLFSPWEAEQERRAKLHQRRRTPLSCGNKPFSNRRRHPKHQPHSVYTVHAYRRAIERGCDLAFPLPEALKPYDRKWGERIEEWAKRTSDKQR